MLRIIVLSLLTLFIVSCTANRQSAPTPPAQQYVQHTVRWPGETLGIIASWYTGTSGNWPLLANANPNLKVTSIRIGDTVQIPDSLVKRSAALTAEFVAEQSAMSNTQVAAETAAMNDSVAANEAGLQVITIPDELPAEEVGVNTKLFQAVMFSDVAEVKSLLGSGADANHQESNRPMLAWAAQNGSVELVEALLAGKADINAKDGIGHTALMRAADMDKANVAQKLIEAKADLNATATNGNTALMMAVESGYKDVVKTLVEGGADPNITTADGNSVALMAAQGGYLELIPILGNAKADLNRSNLVYTPLSYAIEQGNKELVEVLLQAGADPNAKPKTDRAPLILAFDYPEIFSRLIEAKADPNVTNSVGQTALMVAVEGDSVERIEALIKAGANPNAKDSNGATALAQAQAMSKTEIAELLKKSGATE